MFSCAITTSLLGCLVTIALFFRYIWRLNISLTIKLSILGMLLIIGCLPLGMGEWFEQHLGDAYADYTYVLYFIFIGCIVLLSVTICTDIIYLLLKRNTNLATALNGYRHRLIYVNLGLALLLTGYAFYAGVKTPGLKSVRVNTTKIQQEYKIAVLTDMHISRTLSASKVEKIVARTNAAQPDIIVLVGDILDDDIAKISHMTKLLQGLQAKHGIYFVTGNHEFYSGYTETVAAMTQLGFRLLENDGISLSPQLYLAGIPDISAGSYYNKTADLSKAFQASTAEQLRILLSHTPADFGTANNFDLEISGHTHGGQIFPFHILAKLHNKYLAGLYTMDAKRQIYVSRGAGQWGPQMRFLAPAEITLITLIPNNN